MNINAMAQRRRETEGHTPPERLRWIADYLDVADKALSIIACVKEVDYPSDLHRGAQQDLRRWARWLDAHPTLAEGFAVAEAPSDIAAISGRCLGAGLAVAGRGRVDHPEEPWPPTSRRRSS